MYSSLRRKCISLVVFILLHVAVLFCQTLCRFKVLPCSLLELHGIGLYVWFYIVVKKCMFDCFICLITYINDNICLCLWWCLLKSTTKL